MNKEKAEEIYAVCLKLYEALWIQFIALQFLRRHPDKAKVALEDINNAVVTTPDLVLDLYSLTSFDEYEGSKLVAATDELRKFADEAISQPLTDDAGMAGELIIRLDKIMELVTVSYEGVE